MTDLILVGSKGGGSKPRPSVEAPDSLQSTAYARILDLVSEGEIVGLKNDKRSVFLDETPLANEDGSLNFNGVTLDVRTGSQDQPHIPGFPAVENESAAAVELRSDQPWTKAFTNLQLSAVRIRLAVARLAQTNTGNGDTNGYTVKYAIDLATDGGAFVEVLAAAFSGKTTSKYERSHRIDLPAARTGWTVRVRRLTPNATSGAIADTTSVESSTEVIDAKLRYPGSAVIGLQFDASQFQSIPARSFELLGRIIRVPSNYNPQTRVYNGIWDGTFKSAWTDNPAWIYYDLLLHQRYGLGHLLNAGQVDKWELYRIGQYCDQPVSDGHGGTEPRFTCNLYLSVRADALKVLQDLATTFRGMSYWGAGSVMAVADMPEDPVYTYSNANVIDGQFVYGGSAKKTRYSVALVSWNDPADFYRQKVQYVDDPEGIARYGVQQTEISATGCTSQAQAQRIGKWALLTNRLETESITFAVGLDGTLARPGQIIRVADNDRAGRRIGGRLHSSTQDTLTLDAQVTAVAGDTITLVMPTGKAVSRVIKSVAITDAPVGLQRVVLASALDELPPAQSMWAIDSPSLATQQFRVLAVAEDFSNSDIKYSISAVKHVPGKFDAIDNGARIERPPVTVIPPGVQAPPTAISVSNTHFIDQGSAVGTMTIEWARPANSIAFEVYWRKNSGDWVFAGRTGGASVEVRGIYAGRYVAKVRAINALDIGSVYATSAETQLDGKTTPPPSVTTLTANSLLFGIGLKWGFPAGAEDTQRTEIWYSATADRAAAIKLADLAYPQHDYTMQSLRAGVRLFFWARLIDRTGNIGPWYPSGLGVMGQSSADAGAILEQIAGQIGETELGKDLTDRIDLIDGPPALPGSVNSRLKALDIEVGAVTNQLQGQITAGQAALREQIGEVSNVADQLQEQITESQIALQGQIDQVSDLAKSPLYQKEKAYAMGASTRLSDRLYQSKIAVPVDLTGAKAPPNSTYWMDVGQLVSESVGTAARVSITETRVTSIEGVNTAQGTAISGLQTSLTGKADASAVNALTTRVTAAEGVNTSQGSAITGLQNSLPGKADASALSSLTTRVTSAEGVISSQGSSITGLTNSLATTNTNVSAAQVAAQVAADLAGGKGKVIIQSAVPAAADRLVQNLWIDITGNANTPKRWNGSTWVTVTDKVATDAAAAAANALSVANSKADASVVNSLSSRVTTAEGTLTSQGSAITGLNNSLTTTNGNVTAAQNAANAANNLAGGKGKVIVQSAAPAAADQLVQNLWIDITAGANTPKRWTGSAWAAVTDKVATDAAAAAATALNQVATKAEASAVNNLTSRVSSAEGSITSQGSAITGLSNSLTATNSNAAMAQGAAQAASDLAGGKGKVITQAATPAAGDRLPQNLWIDTTANANTPKRWNGTIWVAVSDKVATDAAAAAANALSVANTKADASAMSTLTSRVTAAEGTISSQGTMLTGLSNSLTTTNTNVTSAQNAANAANSLAGGKGKVIVQTATPVAADELTQNLWIDISGGANSPKRWTGTAWAVVTDKVATDAAAAAASALVQVATKADASAVNSLSSRVTSAEGSISSQGTSITGLSNSLSTTDNNVAAAQRAAQAAADVAGGKGKLIIQSAIPAVSDRLAQNLWIDTTANSNAPKRWSGTAWVGVTDKVATDAAAAAANALSVANTKADASAVNSLTTRVTSVEGTISSHGSTITGLTNSLTTTTNNVAAAQEAAQTASDLAGGKGKVITQSATPAATDRLAQNLWIDITGGANTPKRWSGSVWLAVTDKVATDAAAAAASALTQVATKAEATTVSALSNIVTQQGNTLAAQGNALTSITATIGGMTQENIVLDPTFNVGKDAFNPSGAITVVSRTDESTPPNTPVPRVAKWLVPGSTTANSYIGWGVIPELRNPGSAVLMAVAAGEVYEFSADVFMEASGGGRQHGLWMQMYDATGTSVGHTWVPGSISNKSGEWETLSGKLAIIPTAVTGRITLRVSVGVATNLWICNQRWTKQTAAQAANAGVQSAFDARVTQAEAGLTTQAGQIIALNTGLAGKADNSALQSLASTVTQQGGTLTSQGTAVTQLQSTVGAIGGSGSNLLPDAYSWLSSRTLPATTVSTLSRVGVEVAGSASGFGVRLTMGSAITSQFLMLSPTNNAAGFNVDMEAGGYLVSMYVQGSVAGTMRVSMYNGSHRWSSNVAYTSSRQRLVFVCTAAAFARAAITIYPNMSGLPAGTEVTIDSVMIERQIGTSAEPSPFVAGSSAMTSVGQATAISSLDTRVTETESVITAQASRLDGIYVQVNPVRAGDTTGFAGSSESLVGVWSEQSARIEDGVAIGKRLDTVQVAVETTSATVQQVSQAQVALSGKASAMWSVKLQVNSQGQYVAAGVGLGIENTTAGLQSQFLVSADTFAVVNGVNGTPSSPFAVKNGQVFINSAFIQDGTITNAKVTNAAISTAKIANASITTAKIVDLAVDTLRIAGRAVTVPGLAYSKDKLDLIGSEKNGEFAWATIQELSIYVEETSYAQVSISFGTCGKAGVAGDGVGCWRLLKDGEDIASGDGVAQWGSTASCIGVVHNAGTSIYTLQASPHVGDNFGRFGLTVQGRAISFMAVKR